jgi:hypothetical protein
MVKSAVCLLCLAVLSSYVVSTNLTSESAVYCVNGKSSGEFIVGDITLDKLFLIDGVSMKTNRDNNFENKLNLLRAKNVHYFTDGEVKNYYFFSEKVHNFEIIGGKKVNIHVAVKGENVMVGSPIIYYGY